MRDESTSTTAPAPTATESEGKKISSFERLAAINVNARVEKKGKLSYLSWTWALDTLLRADPDAAWEYLPHEIFEGGTVMVHCRVTAFAKARQAHLPVMDHLNKPIVKPNAFQINTAMQRCLVKAIAMHGLGLYIYAGEDLPPGEDAPPPNGDATTVSEAPPPSPSRSDARAEMVELFEAMSDEKKDVVRSHASEIRKLHASRGDVAAYLAKQNFEQEEKMALWSLLASNVRSWIKEREEIVRLNAAAKVMAKNSPTPAELGSQA